MELMLFAALFLVLWAEFVNGWTDAPNAITTIVSTKVLSPFQAVLLATALNILGAFSGIKVAATIGKGIVNSQIIGLPTVIGAMSGIIIWSTFAWWKGLPTSESHALVAGLAGAGLAAAGPEVLLWDGWQKVFIGLLFSTILGFGGGWCITKFIRKFFASSSSARTRRSFGRLQIFSAAFMAFAHGSNDGQKFIGAFALTLMLGGWYETFTVPGWIIFLCAAVMGLGTAFGGWRIIHTMGFRLGGLETYQGFAAETAAASVIELASRLGIPVSTTHTIGTAIMGVGAARRFGAVRWPVADEVISAWILTFPVCATISFLVTLIIRSLM